MVMVKHLYEFESSGYYAAPDREAAIQLVMSSLDYDRDDAEGDFIRDVPDDEPIDAISEDPWDHPNEAEVLDRRDVCKVYRLRLTAIEHAALAPEWGYCFGGET